MRSVLPVPCTGRGKSTASARCLVKAGQRMLRILWSGASHCPSKWVMSAVNRIFFLPIGRDAKPINSRRLSLSLWHLYLCLFLLSLADASQRLFHQQQLWLILVDRFLFISNLNLFFFPWPFLNLRFKSPIISFYIFFLDAFKLFHSE